MLNYSRQQNLVLFYSFTIINVDSTSMELKNQSADIVVL